MGKDKANSSKASNPKEMTISGYVEEVELEEGDTGIMISDGDEEYIVVMDRQGKKLMEHLDEEVEATGMVTRRQGVREIKVSQFRLLDEYVDDDEDDFFEDDDDDDDLFSDRRS